MLMIRACSMRFEIFISLISFAAGPPMAMTAENDSMNLQLNSSYGLNRSMQKAASPDELRRSFLRPSMPDEKTSMSMMAARTVLTPLPVSMQ